MKTFLLSFLLLAGITVSGQIPKPKKNTYVNDFAKVLSKDEVTRLNKRIFTLEKQKQVQLAVILVDKIPAAYDIEDFAVLIGKKWHVGKKQRGIVYVAAIKQRKQRIEVARNLDSIFTGAKSQEILTAIKPSFKAANYSAGLNVLVDNIDEAIVAPPHGAVQPGELAAAQSASDIAAAKAAKEAEDNKNFWIGFIFVAGLITLAVWYTRHRRRRQQMFYNQQFYNNNDPNFFNPGTPGYGGPGYGSAPGYGGGGGYRSYGRRRSGFGSFAAGAAVGAAAGYGARYLQDKLSEDQKDSTSDQQHQVEERNEPANWGNWGGDNDSGNSDFGDSSSFTDNSWSDSDSGFSADSSSDSSSDSDSGGSSDW